MAASFPASGELMLPRYNFKLLPELAWALFVGLLVAVGVELVAFDPGVALADPAAWVIVLLGSAARAVGAALLAVLRPAPGGGTP